MLYLYAIISLVFGTLAIHSLFHNTATAMLCMCMALLSGILCYVEDTYDKGSRD